MFYVRQVRRAFQHAGLALSRRTVILLVKMVDKAGHNTINFNEFYDLYLFVDSVRVSRQVSHEHQQRLVPRKPGGKPLNRSSLARNHEATFGHPPTPFLPSAPPPEKTLTPLSKYQSSFFQVDSRGDHKLRLHDIAIALEVNEMKLGVDTIALLLKVRSLPSKTRHLIPYRTETKSLHTN